MYYALQNQSSHLLVKLFSSCMDFGIVTTKLFWKIYHFLLLILIISKYNIFYYFFSLFHSILFFIIIPHNFILQYFSLLFLIISKNIILYRDFVISLHLYSIIIMIVPNSRTRKGEKKRAKVKGEYEKNWGEVEGNADYKGMVQPSQQHVAPSVEVVEWRLGTRGLGIAVTFWAGILVSSA